MTPATASTVGAGSTGSLCPGIMISPGFGLVGETNTGAGFDSGFSSSTVPSLNESSGSGVTEVEEFSSDRLPCLADWQPGCIITRSITPTWSPKTIPNILVSFIFFYGWL